MRAKPAEKAGFSVPCLRNTGQTLVMGLHSLRASESPPDPQTTQERGTHDRHCLHLF